MVVPAFTAGTLLAVAEIDNTIVHDAYTALRERATPGFVHLRSALSGSAMARL
jgi:hypothetical protein